MAITVEESYIPAEVTNVRKCKDGSISVELMIEGDDVPHEMVFCEFEKKLIWAVDGGIRANEPCLDLEFIKKGVAKSAKKVKNDKLFSIFTFHGTFTLNREQMDKLVKELEPIV